MATELRRLPNGNYVVTASQINVKIGSEWYPLHVGAFINRTGEDVFELITVDGSTRLGAWRDVVWSLGVGDVF